MLGIFLLTAYAYAYEVPQSLVSMDHLTFIRILVNSLIQNLSIPSRRTDTVPAPQDLFHNVSISCVRYA